MCDADATTSAGSPSAVLASHQVSNLALDLRPRRPVARLPRGIALTSSSALEHVVLGMSADGAARACIGS